jgi:hypothetical protein
MRFERKFYLKEIFSYKLLFYTLMICAIILSAIVLVFFKRRFKYFAIILMLFCSAVDLQVEAALKFLVAKSARIVPASFVAATNRGIITVAKKKRSYNSLVMLAKFLLTISVQLA